MDQLKDLVYHHKGVLPASVSEECLKGLIRTIPWNQPTSWFGRCFFKWSEYDVGRYPEMDRCVGLIGTFLNRRVTGAFVNYYRDGEDKTGEHADVYGCDIAGLSLGATRDLYFRHNKTKERQNYVMESGDLMVFMEQVNQQFKHAVPVRKRVKQPRINITCFLE